MSDLMREQFEARYPLAPGCVLHEGKYGFWIMWDESGEPEFSTGMGLTQMKWEAWQASRETLVIEMPKPAGLDRMSSDMTMQEIREDNRFNRALDLSVKAIHAAGVKTK